MDEKNDHSCSEQESEHCHDLAKSRELKKICRKEACNDRS